MDNFGDNLGKGDKFSYDLCYNFQEILTSFKLENIQSRRSQMLLKIDVLKTLRIFTKKSVLECLFNKVAGPLGLQLYQRETLT